MLLCATWRPARFGGLAGNCVMGRLFIAFDNLVKPLSRIIYTVFLIVDTISMVTAISLNNHLQTLFHKFFLLKKKEQTLYLPSVRTSQENSNTSFSCSTSKGSLCHESVDNDS